MLSKIYKINRICDLQIDRTKSNLYEFFYEHHNRAL